MLGAIEMPRRAAAQSQCTKRKRPWTTNKTRWAAAPIPSNPYYKRRIRTLRTSASVWSSWPWWWLRHEREREGQSFVVADTRSMREKRS